MALVQFITKIHMLVAIYEWHLIQESVLQPTNLFLEIKAELALHPKTIL